MANRWAQGISTEAIETITLAPHRNGKRALETPRLTRPRRDPGVQVDATQLGITRSRRAREGIGVFGRLAIRLNGASPRGPSATKPCTTHVGALDPLVALRHE